MKKKAKPRTPTIPESLKRIAAHHALTLDMAAKERQRANKAEHERQLSEQRFNRLASRRSECEQALRDLVYQQMAEIKELKDQLQAAQDARSAQGGGTVDPVGYNAGDEACGVLGAN